MATWSFAFLNSEGRLGLGWWLTKTFASTVVFAAKAVPIGQMPPAVLPQCAQPVPSGMVNRASIRASHSYMFFTLSVGVHVIRTARCRPAVVGMTIEPFA